MVQKRLECPCSPQLAVGFLIELLSFLFCVLSVTASGGYRREDWIPGQARDDKMEPRMTTLELGMTKTGPGMTTLGSGMTRCEPGITDCVSHASRVGFIASLCTLTGAPPGTGGLRIWCFRLADYPLGGPHPGRVGYTIVLCQADRVRARTSPSGGRGGTGGRREYSPCR